jgi:NAD(P)H-dependent flavin oxidoreductase YrpB (nitropropane dioxygenase family)
MFSAAEIDCVVESGSHAGGHGLVRKNDRFFGIKAFVREVFGR